MPLWRALSSFDPSVVATERWRLDLAYDGRGISGFAYQPEVTTVVGLLRVALATTLRLKEEPDIIGAGRTDAGVHAFAQVVHVDLPVQFFPDVRGEPVKRLLNSLNMQLRGQIRVLKAQRVSADFDARHSALWREYRYLVFESDSPALALTSSFAWSVEGPLDIDAMNRAGQQCVGTYDFRSFCRRPTNAGPDDPLLRRVISVNWERVPDEWAMSPTGDPVLRLNIRAQSFCHNMVRNLVSTMVAVGRGDIPENTIKDRLETPQRDHLPSAAPPEGLSLIGVGYEEFAGGPSGFVR